MITSREIRLKSRLVGMPSAENFELVTVSVPRPAPGEVQVQNLWMTVDPYMRGRMADRASYTPSSRPGKELPGARSGRSPRPTRPLDLAVGYSKANTSPILKLFLSRLEELRAPMPEKKN